MNLTDFNAVVNLTVKQTANLLIEKGEEYAGSEDRLANFKRGALLTKCTPLQVALIYASKHYDALSTYVMKDAEGKEQALSEPIEGRINDLINYCFLMKALIVEKGLTTCKPQEDYFHPEFLKPLHSSTDPAIFQQPTYLE